MSGRVLAVLLVLAGIPIPALADDKIPVIGVIWHAANAEEEAAFREPLREGFAKLGYVDGNNVVFDECYAAEDAGRFDECANKLVGRKVDILIAGSIPAARAAQRATSTIPIVIIASPDPVGLKLVASLAHPGANITGLSAQTFDLMAKRVEVLKEAIPTLRRVGLLVGPSISYDTARLLEQMQPATDKFGIAVITVEARAPEELPAALHEMVERKADAAIVSQNPMYYNERKRIADLALEARLPTLAPADLFVDAGALISYGPSWPPIFRNAATFVDKILKGAKPADLPVEQPTVFELTINRRTAEALGIKLPPTLLARADRVIE